MSTYLVAIVAGPYARVTDSHEGVELNLYCRQSLRRYLDDAEIFEITKQGLDPFRRAVRRCRTRSAPSTTSSSSPSSTPGRWRTSPASRSTRRARSTAARCPRRSGLAGRHDPPRDGAHVVRRPRDHALVGRPLAQRELRHLHGQRRPGRGNQVHAAPGSTSPTATSRGRPCRTSCPPPTRSPPTSPTSAPAGSTSTASATPRARRCCASWWRGWARTRSSAACATTSRSTSGATRRLRDFLAPLERHSGRDLAAWTREWLQTAGMNVLHAEVATTADGMIESCTIVQSAANPAFPTLRSHRVGVGLYDLDDDGRLVRTERLELDVVGRAHRARGAAPARPARAAAAQRRRPDLRQDPARRRVDADGHRPPQRPRRRAGALADLGGRVGHDPRRRAARRAATSTSSRAMRRTSRVPTIVDDILGQAHRRRRAVQPPGQPSRAACAPARDVPGASSSRPQPGTPHQLTALRATVTTSDTDAQLATAAATCSRAGTCPQGMVVDQDLRWFLIRRLAAAGRLDEDGIDAEAAARQDRRRRCARPPPRARPGPTPPPRRRPGSGSSTRDTRWRCSRRSSADSRSATRRSSSRPSSSAGWSWCPATGGSAAPRRPSSSPPGMYPAYRVDDARGRRRRPAARGRRAQGVGAPAGRGEPRPDAAPAARPGRRPRIGSRGGRSRP